MSSERRLGRFLLRRQLGTGSFGSVFAAWDTGTQSEVALKVLKTPGSLFRFKREFRALADARHQNLIRLYEMFALDGRWFFSMELVEGRTFREHVRHSGVYDPQTVRDAFRQLVAGIEALHQRNCIHRDLKPANVLVDASGRVVILDFGLMRELDHSIRA